MLGADLWRKRDWSSSSSKSDARAAAGAAGWQRVQAKNNNHQFVFRVGLRFLGVKAYTRFPKGCACQHDTLKPAKSPALLVRHPNSYGTALRRIQGGIH